MKNGDRLRNMTDEQLASFFCDAVATIGEKLGIGYYCMFCPMEALCSPGHTGFLEWLNKESEDN